MNACLCLYEGVLVPLFGARAGPAAPARAGCFATKKDPSVLRASRSDRAVDQPAASAFQRVPLDGSEELGVTHVRVAEPRVRVALQERAREAQKRN